MNSDVNVVALAGVITQGGEDYYCLKTIKKSGATNIIRVWDLPSNINIGDSLTVIGKVACRPVRNNSIKMVMGIQTKMLLLDEQPCNMVIVTGTLVSKTLRYTLFNKMVLDVSIRNTDGSCMPVIIWNELADKVNRDYKLGDKVQIEGRLLSRDYEKVIDGVTLKRRTTEISVKKIIKV